MDFTKFPLTKEYMSFLKTLGCKNSVLEYLVRMEDTNLNYDAKMLGWRMRVRMNESQKAFLVAVATVSSDCTVFQRVRH